MERTISWARTGIALAIARSERRRATWSSFSASGSGRRLPQSRPEKLFSGAAPITEPFTLYINNTVVTPLFVGLSSAGLYQVNLIVPPGLGQGDVPIQAWVTGGFATQENHIVLAAGRRHSSGAVLIPVTAAMAAAMAATAAVVVATAAVVATAVVVAAMAVAMAATVVTAAVVAMAVATAGEIRFRNRVRFMAYEMEVNT